MLPQQKKTSHTQPELGPAPELVNDAIHLYNQPYQQTLHGHLLKVAIILTGAQVVEHLFGGNGRQIEQTEIVLATGQQRAVAPSHQNLQGEDYLASMLIVAAAVIVHSRAYFGALYSLELQQLHSSFDFADDFAVYFRFYYLLLGQLGNFGHQFFHADYVQISFHHD